MQVRIFTVPIVAGEQFEEDLNKFLRSHRILQVTKAFSSERGGEWSVFVEYMDGDQTEVPASRRAAKDYSKELSPHEYERYSHYREIRKRIADEKGVPPYLIFTNEELALLSRYESLTDEVLNGVKSIPAKRIREYGKFFLTDGKENRESDASDMPF